MSDKKQLQTKAEMDAVITELKKKGINPESNENEVTGLGDAVESVLNNLGITQERYKEWFGLKECNCTERKKYLNKLFPNVNPFNWGKKE